MITFARTTFFAIAVALWTSTALAQQAATEPASGAPAASSRDCTSRHDHGAEKGMPKPKSAACADAPASSAAKHKARPRHDHAKFHKNQG